MTLAAIQNTKVIQPSVQSLKVTYTSNSIQGRNPKGACSSVGIFQLLELFLLLFAKIPCPILPSEQTMRMAVMTVMIMVRAASIY